MLKKGQKENISIETQTQIDYTLCKYQKANTFTILATGTFMSCQKA